MLADLRRRLARTDLFAFNQLRRDAWVRRQAALVPVGARVLDVGAGSCPYRELFAGCEYKTQDFSALPPGQLGGLGYGQIDYVGDASNIPVPDASFDVILCTEVLEHVPDPADVVREFARILKPRGRLLLTAPLGSGIHQEPYHYYGGFTPYWYERFLGEAGFGKLEIEPNEGSFRSFGQEAQRFVIASRPFGSGRPWVTEILWAPAWLLLAPVLALAVPLLARYLDRHDAERRFTVGYHVAATRGEQ
jgi:SAM-dependent methyltransferase